MSDDDTQVDAGERDTLPTGRRSTPTYVLTMIADVDWTRMEYVERGEDDPAECYFFEPAEGARVRFERRDREWCGIVSMDDGTEEQTEAIEDMGKAARCLRQRLEDVGLS